MGAFGEVWRRQPPALWDRMWASRKGERITEHLVSMCLESQSVIEIGCGYGHFVKEVLQRNWTGERYIGIDISAGPLKMQGLDPRVTAVRGDFMSILAGSSDHPDYGLLDTKVDLIISQAVLCHQAHWLPMFLAAKSRAKRVAMDISYVTDEPMHRPKRREDGCYDTYTSEKQLREEIAALELPIKVHRMKNVKRNRDELLLVM